MYKRCEKCYENDKTPSNTDCDKCEIEENICHHKALEEIEEVIKSPCAEDCVYYEPSRCYVCIKTSILDIISKAKGEGNAI